MNVMNNMLALFPATDPVHEEQGQLADGEQRQLPDVDVENGNADNNDNNSNDTRLRSLGST